MATAEFDAARARSAGRRRLDDADRAGRYAGARSRGAVQDGARHCRPPRGRPSARPGARRWRRCWRTRSTELLGAPLAYSDEQVAAHPQPAPLRRGPADARRARAGGDGARGGASRQQLEADEAWWSRASDGARERGADAARTGAPRCDRRELRRPTPGLGAVSGAGIKRAYVRVVRHLAGDAGGALVAAARFL